MQCTMLIDCSLAHFLLFGSSCNPVSRRHHQPGPHIGAYMLAVFLRFCSKGLYPLCAGGRHQPGHPQGGRLPALVQQAVERHQVRAAQPGRRLHALPLARRRRYSGKIGCRSSLLQHPFNKSSCCLVQQCSRRQFVLERGKTSTQPRSQKVVWDASPGVLLLQVGRWQTAGS